MASGNIDGDTYAASDVISGDGKLYYRLQLVDKNGAFTYSKTVVVTINSGFKFSLYPNPVRSNLTMHVENNKTEDVTLQVVSVQGKIVYQQQTHLNAGITDVALDVSSLAQGSYILVVKGEIIQQKQFIKL